MFNFLLLILGVGLLTVGGEALIRGSLAAARRLGVSPLLSGLVIVGFGTSAPELVVSVQAALNQRPDIAVGNVVGSNIGNILLILGICALITPLAVKPLALRRDAVTVVAASILFLVLVGGDALGPADAEIFLTALVTYLVWAYWSERYQGAPSAELHKAEAEEFTALPNTAVWTVTTVIIGLLLLIAGSQVLLMGAVGIAEHFGVSEAVIGLTLVAVGNVLGSIIFNLLGILGVSALLQPLPVHARILQFDQWVMLGTSLLLLLFLYTGRCLSSLEGAVLLAGYGVYIGLSFTIYGG